jgi:hypothetical protein
MIASRGLRAEPHGMACRQRFRLDIASNNETVRIGRRRPFRAEQRAIPRPRWRTPGRMVRLGDAIPRRRGSGPVIQSRTQLDALGPAGTGGNRSGGCLAAPRRKDRRSRKRRMDHRVRQ